MFMLYSFQEEVNETGSNNNNNKEAQCKGQVNVNSFSGQPTQNTEPSVEEKINEFSYNYIEQITNALIFRVGI